MNGSEVERDLSEKVNEARSRHQAASSAVREITNDIPSGIPHPDGTFRIRQAFEEQRLARASLARALEQLNDFLLYGIVPEETNHAANQERERALEAALFGLYQAWARLPTPPDRLRPFFAEKFRQMIVPGCKLYKGGVETVRHILFRSKTSVLAHLSENRRVDLSVESLVLSGDWDDLFTPQDRKKAAEKLEQFDHSGHAVPGNKTRVL